MQQMAQGLASLGRGQDSMLVHMTPGEVHGLQSLAQQHGGSLTINPHTGLPEAGFLSSILPMIAGIGLNAMFPGSGMLIGAGIGGLTALASGDLKKGLFAGLGAYGGAGIGESLAAAAPTAVPATASAMGAPAALTLPPSATTMASGAGVPAIAELANAPSWASNLASVTPPPADLVNLADSAGARLAPAIDYSVPGSQMYAGAKEVFSNPTSALSFAKTNAIPIASALAGPAMGMLGTQNTLPPGTGSTGPQNFANYSVEPMKYDPKTGKYSNLRYGAVNRSTTFDPNMTYAAAASGGSMQDIQANSQPVMPPNQMIGGSAPSENQFYPGANIARGGASSAPQAPSATDVMGGYDQKLDQYTGEPVRMAGGGITNIGSIPLGGPIDFNALFQNNPELMKMLTEQQRLAAPQYDYNPDDQQYTRRMAGGGLASLDTYAAGGRLLQGPGDGMSDSIPAVIGGAKPQRAALAQGEFVVPADVVSHLGNGSTDAGSKRLYAMMDKVRHARTGNKKQGRQINPDKFMPA